MTDLPLFQLTEAEVSVFVAQLGSLQRHRVRTTAPDGISELQAATGSANISVSWEDLDSAISFRQFAAYLPDATISRNSPKQSENKEVVEFGYKKLDAKALKSGRLSPGT